jgi:hypothetical protein
MKALLSRTSASPTTSGEYAKISKKSMKPTHLNRLSKI